ncbi:MAG: IS1-like element ISBeg1 family transposase, partial [Thermoplasmata archaeon]
IGKRTRENAVRLLHAVRRTLGEGVLPLFTSDELSCYEDALVEVFGTRVQPLRLGERGRYPQTVTIPPDDLRYAVVHKEREQNHVVRVTRKVRLGTERAVNAALSNSPVSARINTSFVERENGKLRADNGRLVRTTLGFSKKKPYFLDSVRLSIAYDHFCRPHRGLRQEHPQGELPHGAIWEKRSPMMALGNTDHIWSVRELLLYRAPTTTPSIVFGEAQ